MSWAAAPGDPFDGDLVKTIEDVYVVADTAPPATGDEAWTVGLEQQLAKGVVKAGYSICIIGAAGLGQTGRS